MIKPWLRITMKRVIVLRALKVFIRKRDPGIVRAVQLGKRQARQQGQLQQQIAKIVLLEKEESSITTTAFLHNV